MPDTKIIVRTLVLNEVKLALDLIDQFDRKPAPTPSEETLQFYEAAGFEQSKTGFQIRFDA